MKKNNKILLSIIGIAVLIVAVVGVTYAFFNYTRTGSPNTIQVGRIAFNSTQNNTISLENVFPTSSNNLNNTNSDTVTINITGDTTYSEGIEYKVTLDEVNNTINGKTIPISFNVTATNLGTNDTSYYTNRGGEDAIYNATETGEVEDGKYILVGYIPSGEEGINGSIDITAFIDTNKVVISDTYDGTESDLMGTTNDWVLGREVFTTNEWNSFNSSNNSLSFKVRVEANEGIWIEEESLYVLKNLNDETQWKNIRANVTSVEFHKDGIAPANYITSFAVADATSAGTVTLYTVDDGLGNNTYKAIVVADDTIYAPVNCGGIFNGMSNLISFNSKNFKVDNSTNFNGFFANCSKLENVDTLSLWNTSSVTNMRQMFLNCTSLKNVNGLLNWNTSSLTTMRQMFYGCTSLENLNGLANFNVEKVEDMQYMLYNCTNLVNIRGLSSWTTSRLNNLNFAFSGCTNLESLNGLANFDISKVTSNLQSTFSNCSNLTDISALSNWNTENVLYFVSLFSGCSKLNNISALTNWNVQKVSYMNGMFENCSNLTNVDALLIWTTSSLTSMVNMFLGCEKLSNIDGLSNWNTSNVTNMNFMFSHCSNLTDVSATSNWNTSNVEDMHGLFNGCTNLRNVDLSSWDMSKVTNDKAMFQHAEFKTLTMPNNYTRIDNFMFNHNSSYTGESFTIPRIVTTIGNSHIFYNFGQDNTFNKFIVESGSTSLKTIDDVLYSYDGTRLISIPRGKTFANNTYEIPEGVTSLNVMSFSRTKKIDKVVLPNSYVISRWYDDSSSSDTDPLIGNSLSTAIYVYTSVKEYAVKSDNPNYSSNSGCIYSKDGTELIAVPVHYNGVLNIKAGTTTIGQEAFWVQRVSYIDSITQINIPASVTNIETNQLATLNKLMSRSTNPVTITIDSGNTAYQITNNQIVAK